MWLWDMVNDMSAKDWTALAESVRMQDCLEVGSVFMDAVREEIATEKP